MHIDSNNGLEAVPKRDVSPHRDVLFRDHGADNGKVGILDVSMRHRDLPRGHL